MYRARRLRERAFSNFFGTSVHIALCGNRSTKVMCGDIKKETGNFTRSSSLRWIEEWVGLCRHFDINSTSHCDQVKNQRYSEQLT